MNILLISQCHKNALKETRRILDQFAERCGDRTWQTVITKAGLETLHKLLRQTARKNTAVACYWTHGKNLTELLWIVGDNSQFNDQGRIPTNRTKRNILRADDENTWQHGVTIQILATLSALLHDLGKATIGFQEKLKPASPLIADPYRHEWISLQLFKLMIIDCSTNEACLQRLINFNQYRTEHPHWFSTLSEIEHINLEKLPPIAQIIGWLIVSHHRLPFIACYSECQFKQAQQNEDYTSNYHLKDLYELKIKAVEGWVKNGFSQHKKLDSFWKLQADITQSKEWQKQLTRWAAKALNHTPLTEVANDIISNPFFFHLSRLALMIGDHNYSSLTIENKRRVKGDENITLIANTDKKTKQPKQALDEHLIGVAKFTARFASLLPKLPKELPALQKNKAFSQRTKIKRFNWQNHAFDLVKSIQATAQTQGFFGINMASTGCGKTLGNARIMYGLADPNTGARSTIALGLRVLTLQTGEALQQKLQLTDEHLVTLVGGQANTKLFELNQQLDQKNSSLEDIGSESAEEIVAGIIPNSESGIIQEEFGTVIADKKAHSLLYTPIVSCTIDHLMAASENKRGGKHIAPILRLLTGDLILDEPDDFSQQDLPALARLVHLAGMFGSKILLSSATLTPDLITGLFDAYQTGRSIWQQQNNLPNQGIVCTWIDEFEQTHSQCSDKNTFIQTHQRFVEKRVKQLAAEPIRRIARIMPISLPTKPENQDIHYQALAEQLLTESYNLHLQHHQPYLTDKTVSIGLIRIAHTKQLIHIVQSMYKQQLFPEDTQFHLCAYHAKQLLILRSALEKKLDRILNRTDPTQLIKQPEIVEAIKSSSAKNQIFIIIATPVAEIGRDHDYDWAIIEPSSMRSIIQLAGRINRHRSDKLATTPNIAIMQTNIKSLKEGNNLGIGKVCFTKPGFEIALKETELKNNPFLLDTHKTDELITTKQLSAINSIARIQKNQALQPKRYLADLEHAVMEHLFNPAQANYITAYWQTNLAHHACVHLQTISPFRYQQHKQQDYICQLNDNDKNGGFNFRTKEKAWENPEQIEVDTINSFITYQAQDINSNSNIQPWLNLNLEDELTDLAEKLNNDNLHKIALEYTIVSLEELSSSAERKKWYFHPWFGFW